MTKPRVFISHIHEDAPLARLLSKYIEQAFSKALEVFVSSDGTSILLGDKWMQRIETALEESSLAIIIASPNAVARPWINFEAGAAWVKGARVIPACVKGMAVSALPQPLSSLQACDISNETGIELFFDNVANIYDLTCGITDLAMVHANLNEVGGVTVPVGSGSEMTENTLAEEWGPFNWILGVEDPTLYSALTQIFAVREACTEYVNRIKANPTQFMSVPSTTCRQYSAAISKLKQHLGDSFPFDVLDKEEGYSTNPSPNWLLKLSDAVLNLTRERIHSKKI